MHDGFICEDCGFTSREEVGNVYQCPECGGRMRRSRSGDMLGNGGDANASKSVMLWDLLYLVFVGGLSFGIFNWISYWTDDVIDLVLLIVWGVLFGLSFLLFHRKITVDVSDKAIRTR